jgi:hypothetical protein
LELFFHVEENFIFFVFAVNEVELGEHWCEVVFIFTDQGRVKFLFEFAVPFCDFLTIEVVCKEVRLKGWYKLFAEYRLGRHFLHPRVVEDFVDSVDFTKP